MKRSWAATAIAAQLVPHEPVFESMMCMCVAPGTCAREVGWWTAVGSAGATVCTAHGKEKCCVKHAAKCTADSSLSAFWCCDCVVVAVTNISCVSRLAIALLMVVSGLNTKGSSGVSSLQQHSTAQVTNGNPFGCNNTCRLMSGWHSDQPPSAGTLHCVYVLCSTLLLLSYPFFTCSLAVHTAAVQAAHIHSLIYELVPFHRLSVVSRANADCVQRTLLQLRAEPRICAAPV